MTIGLMTNNKFVDYLVRCGKEYEKDEMQATADDYFEAASRLRVKRDSNRTICEWAADLSHKDMQAIRKFIDPLPISKIEPAAAIVPLHGLFQALSTQIALEQGVNDD